MKDSKRKVLVLLDSHAIIHRAYHALPDFASSKGIPTGALYGLSTMLMGIIEKFKPDYIAACYDLPKPTYRHEAYEGYKAGRKKADDELVEQLNSSRNIFKAFHIPMYDREGFEADDMLGTITREILEKYSDVDVVIASGDMDTLQLVTGDRVQVFTLKKGIKDTITYNEDAVIERFGFKPTLLPDYKGLRGDPSDNIIGIQGIGEKTATTLISTFGTIENMYNELDKSDAAFKAAGISDRMIDLLKNNKDEAVFSKMLATIRKDAPIDFTLPDTTWKEHFNSTEAEDLFRELEFRSLIPRVKNITGIYSGTVIKKTTITPSSELEEIEPGDENKGLFGTEKYQDIPELELRKLKLMVSVLNPNISDPNKDDIYAFTKEEDWKKAEEKLSAEIKHNNLEYIAFDIEIPLIPVVDKMKEVGIKIDVDFLKKLSVEYHEKISELEKKIWELAGEEFNVSSPKQLGEILFTKLSLGGKNIKKTSTGAKSTKESELEKLKGTHPIIDYVMEYRELTKLVSTYIDVLPTLVDTHNRIHATFVQIGAATGRMSSQDPNLQNIPIKSDLGKAIREAFIAEKGFKLVSLDYSQIELRIAAILSEDEQLMSIFKEGTDIHSGVASRVFKVPEAEVTKNMRRQAKVINFGILYGMGVTALKTNLESTREEAQQFYNEYFKTFTGLAEYLEETKRQAAKNGYTTTLFGRKRYFEGIRSKLPFIRAAAERMAINAPIQGTNADMVKLAMKKSFAYIQEHKLEDKVRLLLQVHDELVFEIHESVLDTVIPKIQEIMQSILTLEHTKGIPILTSANVGDTWGTMEAYTK
jgi:DNA polymerase-1